MKRRGRSGFSLVELLLAVALLGGVLLALNLFVFSMGDIWGRNAERRLFEQHVRAVTRHVDSLFRRALMAGLSVTPPPPAVVPVEIRIEDGDTQPLLTFELPAGDRLLPWPEAPLPDVVCSLAAQPGRGLVLYWHSRLESRFATDPPRATVLTPWATSLTYDYYDPAAQTWLRESRPREGEPGAWLVPDRVTLHFAHGTWTEETTLVLPAATDALPAF